MAMVHATINGISVAVEAGTTILEAAKKIHVNIPTLCYHEDLAVKAVCRICVVEIAGMKLMQTACSYPVSEGMVIYTDSPKVLKARKTILELILAHHQQNCLSCAKNGSCELQNLAAELNMSHALHFDPETTNFPIDDSSPSIVRDPNKCIQCRRCLEVCNTIQTVGVLSVEGRGHDSKICPPYGKQMVDTACVNCGQCLQVCPVGAITLHDNEDRYMAAREAGKTMVVQIAPSVRTTIAEALGEEVGTVSTGRLVSALKILGFQYVLDTDFSADLTIMEEGTELLQRIQNGGTLPMITSCCPGWVKFCETFYSHETEHLSTAKSPQQMFGAIIKTYFAQKLKLEPGNIFSVSIMPCTAKKFECARPEMHASGYRDVDLALTVLELARMIRATGINFAELPETPFDQPFGTGSGAGEIFAATGGVMEAALRTVYEIVTGKTLEKLEFTAVRGVEGVKETSVDLGGTVVKVAVAHGLGNARKIMDAVARGKSEYHFIEIMACPGGCIGGGGNPTRSWQKVRQRTAAVYEQEKELPIRKSHENPAIKEIYHEFLPGPCSRKSERLLHTHYINRQDIL
ncbi:MAG: NADH-dependent [FeFe] hydrogenase, group A6 [Oscillospiraceae bacterium]|nr:NADH-dependent [FeFe] hydrogenase, group A6 [Oscillospiraceae bacterium]